MSQENLDLVRSIYADWERGDFSRSDWASPGIELLRPEGLGGETLSGVASAAVGWREWLSAWENYRAEASEYRALDDERVLVSGHMQGRGRQSGTSISASIVNLFHIRDGKVIRLVLYSNRRRALADLGLVE